MILGQVNIHLVMHFQSEFLVGVPVSSDKLGKVRNLNRPLHFVEHGDKGPDMVCK